MQTRFCESQLLNSEKTWVENTSHLHILRYGCYDSRVVPADTKLMWKGKPPEKICKLRLFYETVHFVTGRPICTVHMICKNLFFWTVFCRSLKNYERTTRSFLLHFFMGVCFLFCCHSSWRYVFNIEHLVMWPSHNTYTEAERRRERNSVDHYLSLIDLIWSEAVYQQHRRCAPFT